jgi:hypothetical protein
VLKFFQIRRTICCDEIFDEFVLGLLVQRHTQQLKFLRCFALADVVDETKIARELDLEVLNRKSIKFAVVQILHPQPDDRLDLVAFRAERGDEFLRQILVQQDFHAGCNCFWCASSARAPRTDSSVRLGYASTISATDRPAASDSRMNATEIRVPRTRGLPPKCSGSATIQFFIPANLTDLTGCSSQD